jgi:hypothetical protein
MHCSFFLTVLHVSVSFNPSKRNTSAQTSPEVVKRWSNEVQEAVQSRSALVQFHGLALLHQVSLTFVASSSSLDISKLRF